MRKRLSVTLFILLLISIIIFLNNRMSPLLFFQGVMQRVFVVPKRITYSITHAFPGYKKSESNALVEENKKLIEKMRDYENLKKEVQALRSQFKETQDLSPKLVPAKIVGFSGKEKNIYSVVIDKGSREGIKKGMSIVSGKDLVGVITGVSSHYSQVVLPTSKAFSQLGITLSSNIQGIIRGEQDFIIFDHVLTTDPLEKGDVILTKGSINSDGTGVLPGLIVGKVIVVNKVQTNPFQSAEIEASINYAKLTTVFVVMP